MVYSDSTHSDSSSQSDGSVSSTTRHGKWTCEEHNRFLTAMALYPRGPWSHVAEYVGTRTTRQTMTHAQKEHLREVRHARGLRPPGRVAGPNARRRRRSRRRSETKAEDTPEGAEKVAQLTNVPGTDTISTSSGDQADQFGGSFVALLQREFVGVRLQRPPTLLTQDHKRDGGDWIDDFVESLDLSQLHAEVCC